jgi:hypothetical protein
MRSFYGMLSGSAVVTKFISTHICSDIITSDLCSVEERLNKLDNMMCMINDSILQSHIHTAVKALLKSHIHTTTVKHYFEVT